MKIIVGYQKLQSPIIYHLLQIINNHNHNNKQKNSIIAFDSSPAGLQTTVPQ